ncbi:MAG: GGDEF domain-containing protein, partial [Melioribacteraceae bacterium]|nr:GGDEF domain-containing protein [Melioribacteraceae bacterium]
RENDESKNAFFFIISGSLVGSMFKVDSDKLLIGRHEKSHICFEDSDVSRRHAKVIRKPDGKIIIVDLNSTNGTYCNDNRIDKHILKDGDKVQIGSANIMKFSYQDSAEGQFQKELFESASKDNLTKIYNRAFFIERFSQEFSYALRHHSLLSLVILDIDYFKKVNDTYGHQAGDYILCEIVNVISKIIRKEALFARYGGEEFIILLRDINEEKAYIFANRIKEAVEEYKFKFEGNVISLTISVGISTYKKGNFKDHEEMLRVADKYLYKAKNSGRNRVKSILTDKKYLLSDEIEEIS